MFSLTFIWRKSDVYSDTVNPLYNIGVGPQWFMMLKWICRYDFLLFQPQKEKMQNKCATISTWFPNP